MLLLFFMSLLVQWTLLGGHLTDFYWNWLLLGVWRVIELQWLCVQGQTYSQVRMKNISFQNLSPFTRQLISVMVLLAFHLDSIWAQSTLVTQLHVLLVYLQMSFMLHKIQVFLLTMCTDVYESALWGIEFYSSGITWNMSRGGTVPSTKGTSLLEAGGSVFLLEVNCCLSVEVHQGHVAQRGFSWDFVLSYLRWLHETVNRMWTYLNCFLAVHFAKP